MPAPLAADRMSEARLRTIWLVLALVFFLFAWYGSLVPFNFAPRSFSSALLVLAGTPANWHDSSKIDWGMNALLMIPAGFCLLGAAARSDQPLADRLFRSVAVAAACLLVSLSIEFSQNWFPPRVASLADVAAQFLGALAGMIGWWLFGGLFSDALGEFFCDHRTSKPLNLVLLVYVVGLVLYSLAPLDVTLHPTDLARKYRDGKILLVPFSHNLGAGRLVYDLIATILMFIPVGVLASTVLVRPSGAIRSLPTSVLLGGSLVFSIEVLQLFVMTRYADATDVVTGLAGVAVGAGGFRLLSGRSTDAATSPSRFQAGLVICAVLYVILLMAILWAPYNFTAADSSSIRQRMSLFFGVPLSRALQGDYFSALGGFLQKFLLFMPLGGGIALCTRTLKPSVRFVANFLLHCLTAALALAIELGQILLPSRFASFDDVIICVLGSFLGFFAMTWARPFSLLSTRPPEVVTSADKRADKSRLEFKHR